MKTTYTSIGVATILIVCSFTMHQSNIEETPTVPTLYDTIVALDAKWEDAYDNCKLDVMTELIDEDLEFYHDRGGLMTSKQDLIEAVKNNICGKVQRELKAGSIEVSEVPGYGAVEIGQHGFRNKQEQGSAIHYAKFVHVWKKQKDKWTITRVISLH